MGVVVNMKLGDLCRVTRHVTHSPDQYGDLILITQPYISVKEAFEKRGIPKGTNIPMYVEGLNLKTDSFHHYRTTELEVISESR